jgi:hypothetical protein
LLNGESGRHLAVSSRERLGHLGRWLEYVPEDRQASVRTQHLGRLRGADDRVHPVPRLGGDQCVERPPGRLPGFEGCHLDPQAAGFREVGHPCIRLDAEHGATGGLELAGRDARAAADVEHVRPRDPGDDTRHQVIGVAGAGPVVALRVRAERFGRLPSLMRLRRLRWLWLVSR